MSERDWENQTLDEYLSRIDEEIKEEMKMEYEIKNDKLAVLVRDSGIEKTKAKVVLEKFQEFFEQASSWEWTTRNLVITDASQTNEIALARSARLNLKEIRCAAERTRKKLKEGILVEGKLIDTIYNLIEGVIKPLESKLKEKEEFVERQEEARIAKLKTEREECLRPYGIDTQFYNLGAMSDEAFSNLLDMTITSHAAKLSAAQRAEEERIAAEKKAAEEKAERERLEAEERARISAENARLKIEAEERERQIAAERAEAEAKDRKRQAELDRAKRELQEEMDRVDAEVRKANEADEKARRELQAKKDAEAKAKKAEADRIEIERKRLETAGDREKLTEYFNQVKSIKYHSLASDKAAEIVRQFDNILFVCIAKVRNL